MARILIVDDSNIIQNQIERISQRADLEVAGKASNGEEALRLYEACRPDLVTMDLTMPRMNGISCIEEIVALDEDALILVVSALADKFTALQAISKGARGFINKPFSEQDLASAIMKVLATR